MRICAVCGELSEKGRMKFGCFCCDNCISYTIMTQQTLTFRNGMETRIKEMLCTKCFKAVNRIWIIGMENLCIDCLDLARQRSIKIKPPEVE